jgi:hypothetical protein
MILEYICGSTIHEIMVLTTLNFMITIATFVIVILKKPVQVVDDKNLSDLR